MAKQWALIEDRGKGERYVIGKSSMKRTLETMRKALKVGQRSPGIKLSIVDAARSERMLRNPLTSWTPARAVRIVKRGGRRLLQILVPRRRKR